MLPVGDKQRPSDTACCADWYLVSNIQYFVYFRPPSIKVLVDAPKVLCIYFSAPESERKPLSTLISQVFVYRFEPGSFLPPWSGLPGPKVYTN